LIDAIDELRQEVRSSYLDEQVSPLHERLLVESSVAIAIMGERGSGKSTLLVATCAELILRGHDIVLPIMRPELFGETDSVLEVFLASLWSLVSRFNAPTAVASETEASRGGSVVTSEGENEGWTQNVLRALGDVSRALAITKTPFAALERGSDGPYDFAEDSLVVSRTAVGVGSQLRNVVRVLSMRSADKPTLIVVPIDDPDLAPANVQAIIRDIRRLGAIPGVVPIACFNPEDLHEAWSASTLASTRRSYFRDAREMEKVFPYSTRFEIEPLSASHSMQFRPIGESQTIRQKVAALGAAAQRVAGTNWDPVHLLSWPGDRYRLPNPLPRNPRTLVQLWEILDAVAGREVDAEYVELALRRVTEIVAEPLAIELGLAPGQKVVAVGPRADVEQPVWPLDLRVDGVSLNLSATRPFAEPLRATFIQMRDAGSVLLVRNREQPERGPSTADGVRDQLKPIAVSSLLAIHDIAYGSGLFDVNASTSHWLGYNDWRFLQDVSIAGMATDDFFVCLPDARTFAQVTRSLDTWARLCDVAATDTVEDVLCAAVMAAVSLYSSRKLGHVATYREAYSMASALYLGLRNTRTREAIDYTAWFEQLLVHQWHSGLLGSDLVRELCAAHRGAVGDAGLARALQLFDARTQAIIAAAERDPAEHCWVAGYFDLASTLGSETANGLATFHGAWLRRLAAERSGSAALGSVPQVSARAAFAPYDTPHSSELLAAALAALRKLTDQHARAAIRK
jgi:hypothetical protein